MTAELPEKTVSQVVEEWLSQRSFATVPLKWQAIQSVIAIRAYCESKGLDWSEISLLADQGRDVLLASLAETAHAD